MNIITLVVFVSLVLLISELIIGGPYFPQYYGLDGRKISLHQRLRAAGATFCTRWKCMLVRLFRRNL